ncbi:preprotein translocase subunit SecG [Pajaroellobacter abortibovis]|uniref:Protein-export membrane protein SecG n=1 Tax=Pajaroellobacter abortibovis TaxID=1882918 RepID=A0A1L6MVI5_9BACT|nr:preprotein translocase subunit SecG [Pajaroellobacter abortibovis]APR99542.1 preprotein translocase subunit SecG [Pajaroellobacter abortibovis]
MLTFLLQCLHIFVCLFLIFVVLLQQGRGGTMGTPMGGQMAQQVFGGRGAGNLLTRVTTICATIFMITSMSLAYLSTAGDRALKQKIEEAEKQKLLSTESTTPPLDETETIHPKNNLSDSSPSETQ